MPKVIRPDAYNIWRGMLKRCYDTRAVGYTSYGGQGVTVCDRWRKSFRDFIADMGPRPTNRHQIDRKDSTGNYEPNNCRWATSKENQNNRRNNLLVTFQGKTQTAALWSDELGLSRPVVYDRLSKGMPLEQVFNPKREQHVPFTPHDDEAIRSLAGQLTASQIGARIGRKEVSIWNRACRLKISLKPKPSFVRKDN